MQGQQQMPLTPTTKQQQNSDDSSAPAGKLVQQAAGVTTQPLRLLPCRRYMPSNSKPCWKEATARGWEDSNERKERHKQQQNFDNSSAPAGKLVQQAAGVTRRLLCLLPCRKRLQPEQHTQTKTTHPMHMYLLYYPQARDRRGSSRTTCKVLKGSSKYAH
jgi:hypothetical protein